MTPPELLSHMHSGDLLLFLGAGLSIGAGLPSWADLIEPLGRSVGAPWPVNRVDLTTDHLITAAQYYANQHGRNALIRHLQDKLDTTGIQPTVIHKLIASLPIQIIFTTNYDDLIERALRENGKRSNITVSEVELAFWRNDRVQVVKISGDLRRPDSIVLTKHDYNTYIETHRRLVEQLRTAFETQTPLFLGYSLQDPFLNYVWDGIGLTQGSHRRTGYAVLFDAQPLEIQDWEQRGLHIINLETKGRNRTDLLLAWLSVLAGPMPS